MPTSADQPLFPFRFLWGTSTSAHQVEGGNDNNDVHWIKVLVDPGTREVFQYQPQIVPGNRTAVPAP